MGRVPADDVDVVLVVVAGGGLVGWLVSKRVETLCVGWWPLLFAHLLECMCRALALIRSVVKR